jgi:hypothetical protein
MPSIVFATKDAVAAAQIRGSPIQGGSKTLYFNDNFINAEVDLNQQPPVVKESCLDGNVGGNVKFTPLNPGTITIESISIDDGDCDSSDIDNIAKTAYCKFNCDTDSITEKKFKMTVSYTYKSMIDYTFTIYPSYSQTSGSSSTGSGTSRPSSGSSSVGPTTGSGATLTISSCGSACSASCSYAIRTNVKYTGCSDSNMGSLLVNAGCVVTLSDGSTCS